LVQLEGWEDTLTLFERIVSQTLATVLPTSVGETVRNAGFLVLRIAPRRLWVVPDEAAMAPDLFIDPGLGCSLLLGEGRVRFAMSGARVGETLAKCIAIDWHSPAAAPGSAMQTSVHHLPVLFIRTGEMNCELIAPRSFTQSIMEWMAESSC